MESSSSNSNSNSPAPIEQSRRFTRELHSRLVHRFPALFADLTPGAVVRPPHLPSFSLFRAHRPANCMIEQVPTPQGTPSYGATNGAPMGDGMQKLGADASKIEPKVPCRLSLLLLLVVIRADLTRTQTRRSGSRPNEPSSPGSESRCSSPLSRSPCSTRRTTRTGLPGRWASSMLSSRVPCSGTRGPCTALGGTGS